MRLGLGFRHLCLPKRLSFAVSVSPQTIAAKTRACFATLALFDGLDDLCDTKTPCVSSALDVFTPPRGNQRTPVSARILPLLLDDAQGGLKHHNVSIDHAVIAGWTGRYAASVEKHIKELEVLGGKRPATTPIFYRVAAARLTTADSIEVMGGASSGEVEFVLLQFHGRLWVGTGSDHTDREV